MQTSRC